MPVHACSVTTHQADTQRVLQLSVYVHTAGWGLPSIDADCLAAVAFLRITGLPHRICYGGSELMSPRGMLSPVYERLMSH